MVGYIGERARRKKRSILMFFFFITIILLTIYVLPILKKDAIIPSDSLLPTPEEIISPIINITNDDFKLKIFDLKQKILFRDNQINKLKESFQYLKEDNKKILKSNLILSENKSQSRDLNSKILELTNEKKILISKIKINDDKIILLGKEYRNIFNKNSELNVYFNELQSKIVELEDLISKQDLLIKELRSGDPHN